MKTTFRLPSKAIQYGFVEVEFDLPEQVDPNTLGSMYVNYVHSFLEGEQKGLSALLTAPEGPSEPEPQHSDEKAVEAISEGLGATVVSVEEKPWEKKVDAPSKPWENGGSAPKVAKVEF